MFPFNEKYESKNLSVLCQSDLERDKLKEKNIIKLKFKKQENFFSISENVEVTHPYHKINWEDLSETERSLVCQYPCSTKSFLKHLAHDSFHFTDESSADFGFVTENIAAAGMILLLSSFHGDNDDSLFCRSSIAANFCLENELHIETIAEICGKNFNNISSVEGKMKIRNISADAQRLLSVQRKGPKPIKAKRRRKETRVKFATGMIVNVNSEDRYGVIFGWDEDGSSCYAPEESVTFRRRPCAINQFEVGRYFKRFNGAVYEPNPEHSSEYPDE
ncbi:hypothetical protein Anas_13512 [Armadillidium nasatum]|uniref:Hemimethylated DNA-binding domain-containing protein n=1 Tax=Armadillidium nasatum TaxID=96803 RepID=A0A5N5T012_9CRUS|nr:hypothetical protein Anas_13512 [Armadillidium nasatum]